MSFFYWDSSVGVKRYVDEPGSAWVRLLAADPENIFLTSEMTIVEVSAAIAISIRVGKLTRRQGQHAYRDFANDVETGAYQLLAVTRSLIDRAALLPQAHPLKGYDAVHLATALEAARNLADQEIMLVFVSGDDQMLRAAEVEGLMADNPFLHVDLNRVEEEAEKRS
jgi:predicted nucleic acid-binding protein